MSVSEENMKRVIELAGAQYPSPSTQKKMKKTFRHFHFHFPHLKWYGNTPIDPVSGGVTTAEALTWIHHMLKHLSDWCHKMNKELEKLEKELNELDQIIKIELITQLPDIIEEYDLFDVIVTGNNERLSLVNSISTTVTKNESVFCYAFRTEYGFIEATKTKRTSSNGDCSGNFTSWAINVTERDRERVLEYAFLVNNIPSKVNRIWIINSNDGMDSNKEVYYVYDGEIKKAVFNKDSIGNGKEGSLNFDTLNVNYNAYWIVNVLKRIPNSKNYLHYMTLDYKVYEYDLITGQEKLLYTIPAANQDIFDPINDVVEGKSTIWALTYKGTVTRELDYMQGLCFEPCFDQVEMYDIWDTPKQITFTKDNLLGITPANMYQDYANHSEDEGDKSLLSSFIVSSKTSNPEYVLDVYELCPRKFDNSIVADNLDRYFTDAILNNLYDHQSLSDYQGYFSYDITNYIKNFNDTPSLMLDDAEFSADGVKFVLENSEFIQDGNSRMLWQRLKVISVMEQRERYMRLYDRVINQIIKPNGIVHSKVGRWYDSSLPTNRESISFPKGKFDYLSLAGSHKIYNAAEFELKMDDTPLRIYTYYELPLDKNHPLFKDLENKNIIVDVTKGTVYEKSSDSYEIVIKLTYQDDYAELQFRRVMRFDYKDFESKSGGRNRATYISPWAYVYYTVRDDSAPDDYEDNPNQGIDQKFEDIINNIYEEINNIYEKIEDIESEINDIKQEINEIKEEINNINNEITEIKEGNAKLEGFVNKLIANLEEKGVWSGGQEGDFVAGMGIAGGNINLYGGSLDGSTWIKTNNKRNENDLAGGV